MSTADRIGADNFERDVMLEARDLGYVGDDVLEAVLILCMDGYEDDRDQISATETVCLIHRWIVRLFDDAERPLDDAGALVQTFADADRASEYFATIIEERF